MASLFNAMAANASHTSPSQNSFQNMTQTGIPPTPLTEVCLGMVFNKTGGSSSVNSVSSVSKDVEMYAQTFQLCVLLVLFFIGVPANAINMAVFHTQGLKDRVNLCLFALSLTDASFLVASFCLNSENIYLLLTRKSIKSHWNAYMVNHHFIFFFGTGFISLVLSAIIACERCYCVINPLRYQTWLRTRTMALIIFSVYFTVLSLHFVVSFKYRVGCIYNPVTDEVTTALTAGEFYTAHKELIDGLEGFVFGLIICGGMMLVVITATIITTVKLRQLMTWRTETSSSLSSRDVALTKMLIGSSVFFIICASPASVFRVVWLFLPEISAGGEHSEFYLTTLWVLEGFCYINYTFNFFIYYVMGSRYRDTFWAMFGKSMKQTKASLPSGRKTYLPTPKSLE